MTRLEQHKQKQFYRKVVLMISLLIFLVLFIFFIGFQFILKSSSFVGGLGKDSDAQASQEDFFGNLDVDALPSATNSAQFIVSGSVSNFDIVEVYVNKSKKKTKILDGKDTFSEKISGLEKGKNEVYIKALTEDKKHSDKSDVFTLMYKNEKPKLEISEPADNTKTDKTEIAIMGITDKDVSIRVNDLPTVVDSQGGFRYTVRLKEGENKIKVVAEDDAGNIEQKELTISYQKDG